jgi:hypothetical protein
LFISHEILYSINKSSGLDINLAYHFEINKLHQLLLVENISPGTANKSFHKSSAKFAVINVHDLI